LTDFAIRSFRNTGDEDYIAARLSFKAELHYPSIWQSQQAIEKYLKCILLLYRIPARNVFHDLSASLLAIEHSGKINLSLTPASTDFITHLNDVGEFRYFEVSTVNHSHRLISLDRAVWELRRYCTYDPKPRSLELTLGEAAPMYRIDGGILEEVLKDKEHPGRRALIWNNCFFSDRIRKTVRMRPWFKARNAPLYMHPEILDEVLRYVHLPLRLVKEWRHHKAPGITVPPDS
jgi:hypothetical protein